MVVRVHAPLATTFDHGRMRFPDYLDAEIAGRYIHHRATVLIYQAYMLRTRRLPSVARVTDRKLDDQRNKDCCNRFATAGRLMVIINFSMWV